jgi:hypothetical protein
MGKVVDKLSNGQSGRELEVQPRAAFSIAISYFLKVGI